MKKDTSKTQINGLLKDIPSKINNLITKSKEKYNWFILNP